MSDIITPELVALDQDLGADRPSVIRGPHYTPPR